MITGMGEGPSTGVRKGEIIDPWPDTVCLEGDELICLLSPDAYDAASDSLELINA